MIQITSSEKTQGEIKPKKPIWKKWWFWVIAVFVILIIASAGGEKKEITPEQQLPSLPDQEQPPQEVKKEEPKQEVKKEEPKGEIVMTDELAVDMIKTVLKNKNVIDVETRIADGRAKGGVKSLILSYKSTGKLPEETGHILGSYLGAVKNGWDIDELGVVVGNIYGTAIGMWCCSKEWTNDYINGKISMEELSAKVLGSMKSL